MVPIEQNQVVKKGAQNTSSTSETTEAPLPDDGVEASQNEKKNKEINTIPKIDIMQQTSWEVNK